MSVILNDAMWSTKVNQNYWRLEQKNNTSNKTKNETILTNFYL